MTNARFIKILEKLEKKMAKGLSSKEAYTEIVASGLPAADVKHVMSTVTGKGVIRKHEAHLPIDKKRAESLGEDAGQARAEYIFTDTSHEQLADALERRRHRARWEGDDLTHPMSVYKVPASMTAAFKRGYIKGGIAANKKYIEEAIEDGYIQEV